jgi:hypothetical protein
LFPSVESIEEFKVTTANNNAEFNAGHRHPRRRRSGTNQLHGTAFWFNQNSNLSATTQFTPRDASGQPGQADIEANSFGISGGGRSSATAHSSSAPMKARAANEVTLSEVVPPDAWRAGDLSSVAGPILNPVTGRVVRQQPDSRESDICQDPRVVLRAPEPVHGPPQRAEFHRQRARRLHRQRVRRARRRGADDHQKIFGRLTWKNVDDRSPGGSDWKHHAGRSLQAHRGEADRGVTQLGARRIRQRAARRLVEHGGEGQLHERIRRAPTGAERALWGLPARRPRAAFRTSSSRWIVHLDRRRQAVRHPLTRRAGQRYGDWMRGQHTIKGGADLQYVEYKDQISFFDGEELGRYAFDGASPAMPSPTSSSGCRTSPAISCPRPT